MRERMLRTSEAARALNVSLSTVYELVRQGTIPSVRLGKLILVPEAQLEARLVELRKGAVDTTAA